MRSQKSSRAKIPNDTSSGAGNFLFAAFYLVVLAFFIVLNSISTLEESKKQKSIGSVRYVFASEEKSTYLPYRPVISSSTEDDFSDEAEIGDNLYSHLHNILTDTLTLIEATVSEDSEGIKLDIPVYVLFKLPDETMYAHHIPFLEEVAHKLIDNPQISVKIMLPTVTSKTYPSLENNSAMRLSSQLIQLFLHKNISPDQLFIGLHSDEKRNFIRFLFSGSEQQETEEILKQADIPSRL